MKAYKFRFESVLKSKKIIVDQLASKAARAAKIQMMEERKLGELIERRARCMVDIATISTGPVDVAEVRRCQGYLDLLGRAVEEQEGTIGEIVRRVDALRSLLTEAEKERKILEKLDEKARAGFYREFQKKEQAALDEVGINSFILRSAYERLQPPTS
jgi:flagellar FliJ protein